MIDELIQAIKFKDENYFGKLQDKINKDAYQEFLNNFNDTSDDANGYILQPKLSYYFNSIYGKTYFEKNRDLLEKLKIKDELFCQNTKENTKHKTDFRYKIITTNKD